MNKEKINRLDIYHLVVRRYVARFQSKDDERGNDNAMNCYRSGKV